VKRGTFDLASHPPTHSPSLNQIYLLMAHSQHTIREGWGEENHVMCHVHVARGFLFIQIYLCSQVSNTQSDFSLFYLIPCFPFFPHSFIGEASDEQKVLIPQQTDQEKIFDENLLDPFAKQYVGEERPSMKSTSFSPILFKIISSQNQKAIIIIIIVNDWSLGLHKVMNYKTHQAELDFHLLQQHQHSHSLENKMSEENG